MLGIVALHAIAAIVAPLLVRLLGARAFLPLALAPLVAVVWAVRQTGTVLDGGRVTQVVPWVPGFDLSLAFSMGALQWLMTLIVAGIGVLVMVYCAWYFGRRDDGLVGFASSFVAFVGAMLGLVLADDLLLLYVFWELTTVCSFLLIGFHPTSRSSRQAASQALIVTTFGGLVMLVGMLLLGHEAGTLRISEVLADPPASTATTVAILLVLVGALTKSAQIPFSFWLPGAMAAPTPVSAYLHAASMVKAGVYLVALLAPAFAGVPGWHLTLLVLGAATMLAGGWRALRQYDIKLLLAYGTVSQLGFLTAVLAIGTRTAALAGVAMLLAHALFKATLFLVVGIVDKRTGTRDLRELSGVGRSMPAVAVIAALAGLSMAGVLPLLGFVAKETVLIGLLELTTGQVPGIPAWAGIALTVSLLLGSVLTVAYTARFWWGAFWRRPGRPDTEVRPAGAALVLSPALLAGLSLVLGFAGGALTTAIAPYADLLTAGEQGEYLALWHGFTLPLWLSLATLAAGLAVFAVRGPLIRFQARVAPRRGAEALYWLVMRSVDRAAVEVTGTFQRGSVWFYLTVIVGVVVLLPGYALVRGLAESGDTLSVTLWDRPAQAAVALVMVAGTIFTVRSRRRLRAMLLAGVSGYGCAVLFLLQGAPDIALTQVLVETVTLVVFVLVLRRLPDYFTDRPLMPTRYLRMALSAAFGLAVGGFLLLAGNGRVAEPISAAFARGAYEFGYGRNVVNVTLVDIRAWDTFGEIAVLVVAATGVASLIFLDSRSTAIRRVYDIPYPEGVQKQSTTPGRRVWLPAPRTMSPDRRSILFEVVTRLIFHTIMVFSAYLLIAGHNFPGGGFAAGMVAGLALIVRYLAGGRYELNEAAPIDAGALIGTGLFVAALAALGPVAFGGSVLETFDSYLDLPLLGEVHLVSSIGFDIGVYLVVVGLVLDLLRTFGARLDRQILQEERAAAGVDER